MTEQEVVTRRRRPKVVEPTPVDAAPRDTLPTVIVDDVRVTYRVVLSPSGRRRRRTVASGATDTEPSRLGRLLTGRQVTRTVVRVRALRGVSLTAYEGDIIGVIGHNGSGKSTLMRVIAGVLPPTSGAVYAQGEPALLGIGAALMKDLSGERNITLGGLALGLSPAQIRERHAEIVRLSGLGSKVRLPMRAYSSGMAARLRFAIATAATPHVLLIDEALSTGDAQFRKRSQDRIKAMREEAGTVFIVSHGLSVIQETCNRCLWLHRGKLRMDGPTDEVIAAYREWVQATRSRRSRRRRGGSGRGHQSRRPGQHEMAADAADDD